MGLSNSILTKERIKCPKCNHSLRYCDRKEFKHRKKEFSEPRWDLEFQSKDMYNRGKVWRIGDKITINDGGLLFEAKQDTVWQGCQICPNCNAFIECDIIIKDGIIKEIKLKEVEE